MGGGKVTTQVSTPIASVPEKTPFERELEEREAKARQGLQTAHGDIFDTPAPNGTETPAAELPTPEAGAETPEPETPAAEVPPATPAEPAKPASEAAPAATPAPKPETTPEQGYERRKQERELRALRKELEDLKKSKETPPATPETPAVPAEPDADDPFGIKAEIKAAREDIRREILGEVGKTQQQVDEERLRAELTSQETAFRTQHPDYDDAVQHMVRMETRRFQRSGAARFHGQQMMSWLESQETLPEANRHSGYRVTREALDRVADERGIGDLDAAMLIATDLYIGQQRNNIIMGARAEGKSIAEKAYEMARESFAYVPPENPPPANGNGNGTEPAAPAASVAERVRASARATAATKSLSNVNSAGAAESGQPQITTFAQLMAFRNKDPEGFRNYVREMSAKDPQWQRKLTP